MCYRRLGDAGTKVSTVVLGGWTNFGDTAIPAETLAEIERILA
jgi:aryl-alcohol dehydrogenase-like predicted oxidoreductase